MTIDRFFEKELHCNAARSARQPLSAFASRFTALRAARCSRRRRGRKSEPRAPRTGYVDLIPLAIQDRVARELALLVRVIGSSPRLHIQSITFHFGAIAAGVKLQAAKVSIA